MSNRTPNLEKNEKLSQKNSIRIKIENWDRIKKSTRKGQFGRNKINFLTGLNAHLTQKCHFWNKKCNFQ